MNILSRVYFEPIYFHNSLIKRFGHPFQLKYLMRKIYVQQVGLFWLHVFLLSTGASMRKTSFQEDATLDGPSC